MPERKQPKSGPLHASADDHAGPPQAWLNAWQELTPPLPGGDLDQEDPATRAAVNWMRDAWSQVEVPLPSSRNLSAPKPRVERRLYLSAILATAAATVLWLSFAARPAAPAKPQLVASHAPASDYTDQAPLSDSSSSSSSSSASTSPFGNSQPVAVQADQLIFQSGSVRLQLILPSRDPVPSQAEPSAEFPALETENQR